MKKNLIASLFFSALTLGIANAQKPKHPTSPIKTIDGTTNPKNLTGLSTTSVVKQNGISIIILEVGSTPCGAAKLAVSVPKFADAPNTPVEAGSKGLDASIEQCCSVSTTGTFQLRTTFVDCDGVALTTKRTIDLTTSCRKRSTDLMPTILEAIGTPPEGKTYKVQKIKVWQN